MENDRARRARQAANSETPTLLKTADVLAPSQLSAFHTANVEDSTISSDVDGSDRGPGATGGVHVNSVIPTTDERTCYSPSHRINRGSRRTLRCDPENHCPRGECESELRTQFPGFCASTDLAAGDASSLGPRPPRRYRFGI
jgi:hypothetical protein